MKKHMVILAVFASLRAGCATTHYVKAGGSADAFERDRYRCENELGIASAVGDPLDKLAYWTVRGQEDMDRCLRSKGWSKQ